MYSETDLDDTIPNLWALKDHYTFPNKNLDVLTDMNKPTLYLLVGCIASGKSLYSRNAAKSGKLICSDDAIVDVLTADQYILYEQPIKIAAKTVENCIITTGMLMGLDVVLDCARNVRETRQRRFISWAHSFDCKCVAIVFPREDVETHALRRYQSDDRGYSYEEWLKIAKSHEQDYHEPTTQNGFDNVYQISWQEIQDGKVL